MAVVTSYTTLLTAITDFVQDSTLSSFAPNFVQNWEERFYRDPKNFGRWMETSLDSTIASDVIAVPSNYLGLKFAYVDGNPSSRLDRVSLNQLYGTYPRNGHTDVPIWISRDTSNFVFGPEPDDTYTIKGVYWAKQTVMRSYASDAAAHWIIVNAPDLALYGALAELEAFKAGDDRVALWKAAHDIALQAYRDLQRDEEVSGSPVQEILA